MFPQRGRLLLLCPFHLIHSSLFVRAFMKFTTDFIFFYTGANNFFLFSSSFNFRALSSKFCNFSICFSFKFGLYFLLLFV